MRRHLSSIVFVLLSIGGLAAGQSASSPAPPATFKVQINYVEVSVRVLDDHGYFVSNLGKSDFRILEDGRPQTINAFGLVEIPFARREQPHFLQEPIDSDIVSNRRESGSRIYVLALDDLHTDPLRTQRVRAAARKFIVENLGVNDLAAVTVIGRSDATQEPTKNQRSLLAAVDKFTGQGRPSQTLEKIPTYNRQIDAGAIEPGSDLTDPDIIERLANDRRTFRTLTRLVEWMGGIRGRRKALIYFSEGFGYDFRDVFRSLDSGSQIVKPDLAEMFDNTRDVISAATRSDVNIYAVDPRGLSAGDDDLIATASLADAGMPMTAADSNVGNNSPTFRPELGVQSAVRELQAVHENLRMLSEETGGFAALNSNDFSAAFQRIVDENSSYYLLGYSSTNTNYDGKYRKIDIGVPGRPAVIVHGRKGYLAARRSRSTFIEPSVPNVSAQLRDLLQSPVPLGGVTFAATAATFRGPLPDNHVIVTLEIKAKDVGLTAKDGKFAGSVAVVVAALDGDGKIRTTSTPTLTVGLKPETYSQIAEEGSFRIICQFGLPPGRYQLRSALAASSTNTGAVQYDLEVPDFTKGRLSLSSVVLVSARANRWPTIVDRAVDSHLPGPTALREFSSEDELGLYVEPYVNQLTPIQKIGLRTTVRDSDGRVAFSSDQERSSADFQNTRGMTTRVPLKGLVPGLYVLTVEARAELGDGEPLSRQLQFRIR